MSYVIKDDELEHTLLRNTELFQHYLQDNKNYSDRKAVGMFTDEEVAKYESIFPDSKLSSRRRKIMAFLQVHPELRSTNPQIVYQRIALYHNNYGPASQSVEAKRTTPIQDTISQLE